MLMSPIAGAATIMDHLQETCKEIEKKPMRIPYNGDQISVER